MNCKIDLSQSELNIVIEILKRLIPETTVLVFGSRATGNAKKMSDLDLCLLTAQALDFRILSDLKDAFVSSDLRMRVDICEFRSLPEGIKEKVTETGIALIQQ